MIFPNVLQCWEWCGFLLRYGSCPQEGFYSFQETLSPKHSYFCYEEIFSKRPVYFTVLHNGWCFREVLEKKYCVLSIVQMRNAEKNRKQHMTHRMTRRKVSNALDKKLDKGRKTLPRNVSKCAQARRQPENQSGDEII